jgi:uncharacterized protein
MEMVKRLEPLWLTLIMLGALNWGIVGLFDTNVIAEIFGSGTVSDVLYVLVGFSALMLVPRLADELSAARPHGA